MRKKLLLSVLLMWTASIARSQDTTSKPVTLSLSKGTLSLSKSTLSLSKGSLKADTLDVRPVCFPFWMALQIALGLEEKEHLEQEADLLHLENSTLKSLVAGLELKDKDRRLQLQLLNQNQELLQLQLQAEKKTRKAASWITQSLQLLAALGTGFLLGSL